MRRGKLTAVAAMVATVAMVTAACGSSTDEEPGDTGSTSNQSESVDNGATDEGGSEGSSTEDETTEEETPPADTTEEETTDEGSTDGSSSGAFQFGYVLPLTGQLAYLGPPQVTAVNYAISLINEAGGINGAEVPDPIAGDEANDAALAQQAATKEINAGVNAIIGAAATGMTMAIIDSVTSAGVAECSGSNTGIVLTDYPKKMGPEGNQMYYRTAPPDSLQGPVLGQLVLSDGYTNVAIVFRNDDYGKGLANSTAKAIEAGGGTVVMNQGYDIKTTDFSGLATKIKASNPDAIVTVSFAEGWQLWKALVADGLTPDKVGVYGADGMRSADAPKETFGDNAGVIDGWGGTAPASVENPDFIKSLKAFNTDLSETQFAPQVFDCVNIFALAAQQAGSNDASDWAANVIGITKGGTECNTFADCKKLLDSGEDIHYVGASGDLSFTEHGEPGKTQIEIYRYENGGQLVSEGTQVSQIG